MPSIWTAPRTWTVGEIVTAGQLNTHLRDNLEFLKTREDTPLNSFTTTTTAAHATTSSTFVEVNAGVFTFTITCTGSAFIMLGVSGVWKCSTAGGEAILDVSIDGTRIGDASYGSTMMQASTANYVQPFAFTTVRTISAGTRTLRLHYRTNAGNTLTLGGVSGVNFFGVELL
jgi:hypothetical protein